VKQATQFRKAVLGGSLMQLSLNRSSPNENTPMRLKRGQTLPAIAIAVAFALVGEAQANIVYDVNLAIGAGKVVGAITTDGKTGSSQRLPSLPGI